MIIYGHDRARVIESNDLGVAKAPVMEKPAGKVTKARRRVRVEVFAWDSKAVRCR